MAAEDYIDYCMPWDEGYEDLQMGIVDGPITCKYCNKSGFHFEQLPSGKWWLFDFNGNKHKCK